MTSAPAHTHKHKTIATSQRYFELFIPELGAKADPSKFKRIFTNEKKMLLFEYKLRVEISAQIRSTVRSVDEVRERERERERE